MDMVNVWVGAVGCGSSSHLSKDRGFPIVTATTIAATRSARSIPPAIRRGRSPS